MEFSLCTFHTGAMQLHGGSRSIILPKRDAFQKACRNFDPEKVVRFSEADISRIVRSSAKIEATIGGSRLSKKN